MIMQNIAMTPGFGSQNQNADPLANLEKFLKLVIESLDTAYRNETPEYYKSTILPQLLPMSRVILNGQPFGSKVQFQELWSSLPVTQHQVTSFDAHILPTQGEQQLVVLAHLKVRFDESGRNRFGQTADLHPQAPAMQRPSHTLFSNCFGVSLTMVVSEKFTSNFNSECISSFDYRITEAPESSVFTV